MSFDGKAFGQEIVAAVKAHIGDVMAPVAARIEALEKRLDSLSAPKDADEDAIAERVRAGLAADIAEVKAVVDAFVIPDLPEMPDVPAMIAEAIGEARAADAAQVQSWMDTVDERIAALPVPENGKDADPEVMREMVDEAVTAAVAALPPAEPGKSLTVDDVAPMLAELVDKAVGAVPAPENGRDGLGIKELLIDRVGDLVATMTDGDVRRIGPVVGKDADMTALEKMAREMIAALPKPKDGEDGLGFDDLDMLEETDGLYLRFARGENVKRFRLPVVIDRGIYREGLYRSGDGVTYGGSFWIAQEDTTEKPDSGKGWRLAVKRGRDGKDGGLKAEKPKTPLKVG